MPIYSCLLQLLAKSRITAPATINIMKTVHINLAMQNTSYCRARLQCIILKLWEHKIIWIVRHVIYGTGKLSPFACVSERTTYAWCSPAAEHFTVENKERRYSLTFSIAFTEGTAKMGNGMQIILVVSFIFNNYSIFVNSVTHNTACCAL
jgi:hypothetical protein